MMCAHMPCSHNWKMHSQINGCAQPPIAIIVCKWLLCIANAESYRETLHQRYDANILQTYVPLLHITFRQHLRRTEYVDGAYYAAGDDYCHPLDGWIDVVDDGASFARSKHPPWSSVHLKFFCAQKNAGYWYLVITYSSRRQPDWYGSNSAKTIQI